MRLTDSVQFKLYVQVNLMMHRFKIESLMHCCVNNATDTFLAAFPKPA